MFCQVCISFNDDDQEYCRNCGNPLLAVSGNYTAEDQEAFESDPEEQFSFDEHLLERISILEEVAKRSADTLRQVLGTLYKLEQKILVNQTGVTTLRDLLEAKQLLAHEEWSELWEARMDHHLLALEKRERFAAIKDRVSALYRGERRDEFQQLLEEAEVALLGFDIDDAVRVLEEAHELDHENYELSFFLAETYFNEGESDRAFEHYTRVLTVKPDHYESLVYSGVLCHERGEIGRSEELLKRAVALYPDSFLPAFSLGAVYAGEGQLSQAVVFLEKAVAADPLPQAFYLLGSCCYEMGKVSTAIRHLREAVRLDPSFEAAYHLLGLAFLDRRWYRKALEAFREAQRLDPGRLAYAELRSLLPDRGEGLPAKLGTEASEWLRYAEQSMSEGRIAQALSCYRRALSFDPDQPDLLLSYAMACLELGRVGEIEPLIDKVLQMKPGERLKATAYATWIEALRAEGRYREGHQLSHRLLKEVGSEFAQTLAYYEMACNLAEMEEELDQALGFAQRSLELSPEDLKPYSLAALGWIHYKRREFEEAINCLTAATELQPSLRTLTHLGIALLAAGRREKARRVLVEVRDLKESRNGLEDRMLEYLKGGTRRLLEGPRGL